MGLGLSSKDAFAANRPGGAGDETEPDQDQRRWLDGGEDDDGDDDELVPSDVIPPPSSFDPDPDGMRGPSAPRGK